MRDVIKKTIDNDNNDSKNNQETEVKISTVFLIFISIIAVYLFLAGVVIYVFNIKDNKIVKLAYQTLPYPAVIVDYRHVITLKDLSDNVVSVKNFYENQDFSELGIRIDFSTPEGKKRLKLREKDVLNKMIEDKMFEIIAKDKDIKLSSEVVYQEIARQLEEKGTKSEELEAKLQRLYGWSIEDFAANVVRPDLYREKLEKLFEKEISNEDQKAKDTIEKAKQELQEERSFRDVAKRYSEDPFSYRDEEDIEWIPPDILLPKVQERVVELDKGQKTEIIETDAGYHIVNLVDQKVDTDDIKIRHIFVSKPSFIAWLEKHMVKIKAFIPLRDYEWNRELMVVDFSQEEMIEYEKEVLEDIRESAEGLFSIEEDEEE